MKYCDWVQRFKPTKNKTNNDAPWGGFMFETYGPDLRFINSCQNEHIWTVLDNDTIIAGWHLVNRVGYMLTSIPWRAKQKGIVVRN